ncbi:hypothetical protein SPHINGOT1_10311 [Sphingomonas sp. T1]|nr:hypothetical protein SPHINGOT1_10311 [Sphingomonas sp. T1]
MPSVSYRLVLFKRVFLRKHMRQLADAVRTGRGAVRRGETESHVHRVGPAGDRLTARRVDFGDAGAQQRRQ